MGKRSGPSRPAGTWASPGETLTIHGAISAIKVGGNINCDIVVQGQARNPPERRFHPHRQRDQRRRRPDQPSKSTATSQSGSSVRRPPASIKKIVKGPDPGKPSLPDFESQESPDQHTGRPDKGPPCVLEDALLRFACRGPI